MTKITKSMIIQQVCVIVYVYLVAILFGVSFYYPNIINIKQSLWVFLTVSTILIVLTTWIGAKIILQGNKDTRGKLYKIARFIYSPVTYFTWYTKQSIAIREMETLAYLLRNKKYNKIPFTKLDESTTVKECYLIDGLYKNILQKIYSELIADLTSDNPLKGEFEKYVICNNYISYRIVLPTGYVNMVVCTKKERTVGKEDRIDNVYIDRKDIVEIISRQMV